MAPAGIWVPVSTLECLAQEQLEGVGDPELGEWTEWTGRAYHLRRRLSHQEAKLVGPVIDVRGTWEARKRLDRVGHWLPDGFAEQAGEA